MGASMIFKNRHELNQYIHNNCSFINFGSKGSAYYDRKTKTVIKLFDMALSDREFMYFEYKDLDFLRFSDALNNTYIFPFEEIILDGRVVGYITALARGRSLYKIDPLSVNLDSIREGYVAALWDIRTISKKGILSDDLPYNTLYSSLGKRFHMVDTDDYHIVDKDPKKIYEDNVRQLSYSIKTFLVDGYFDNFIKDYPELVKLYNEGDLLPFLKKYRKALSERVGKEITTLGDAKDVQDEEHWREYMRIL